MGYAILHPTLHYNTLITYISKYRGTGEKGTSMKNEAKVDREDRSRCT